MFFYRILNVLRICYNILSSEKKTDTKLHIHYVLNVHIYTQIHTDRHSRQNTGKKYARVFKVVISGWKSGIMMTCIYFYLYFPVVYIEQWLLNFFQTYIYNYKSDIEIL